MKEASSAPPWLTVIIPVYNGAATLGRTLASLPDGSSSAGEGGGIEILLINQGSRDASRAIAESEADRLSLRIIDAPQNVNWMQNTNLGLREARAATVTMLHQDDIWMPGRAEALRDQMNRFPQAGMWLHASAYIDDTDRLIGHFRPPFGPREALIPGAKALAHLMVQNTIALPSVAFRRDLALMEGLDETLWYTADWDLWLRLARTAPVAWSPKALTGFRLHRNSLTVTGSRDLADFSRQLEIPPERHIGALPQTEALRLGPQIAASNALNIALAGRFHGSKAHGGIGNVIGRIAGLGPCGILRFFRDTRIISRISPRLRLMRKGNER